MIHEILHSPPSFTSRSSKLAYSMFGTEAESITMSAHKTQSNADGQSCPAVFDRAHLSHYTMHSADLEREILGLFLTQLPATVSAIETAETAADWKLATHTLKGSCAAVGARRLQDIAQQLVTLGVGGDSLVRDLRLQSLEAAVAEFRQAVRHILP